MAGAINGIGSQPQVSSVSTSSEARGGNEQVREKDQSEALENTVQSRSSAAAETQNSETKNQEQNNFRSQLDQVAAQQKSAERERGSLVDITV